VAVDASSQSVHTRSQAHPASCSVGTQGALHKIKRSGREADHLPHLVPSIRMNGAVHPLPLYLMQRAQGKFYLESWSRSFIFYEQDQRRRKRDNCKHDRVLFTRTHNTR